MSPQEQKKAPTILAALLPCRPAGEGRDRRGRWFLGPPGPPATATSGPQEVTTSQITVGVHIGWITSLSRRGPKRGPGTHHHGPDADSRPVARTRCLRQDYRKERSRACVRSDRFALILHEDRSTEKDDFHLTVRRPAFIWTTPLPATFCTSWSRLKRPWVSRYATIFSAVAALTPSSFISSLLDAVLTLIRLVS